MHYKGNSKDFPRNNVVYYIDLANYWVWRVCDSTYFTFANYLCVYKYWSIETVLICGCIWLWIIYRYITLFVNTLLNMEWFCIFTYRWNGIPISRYPDTLLSKFAVCSMFTHTLRLFDSKICSQMWRETNYYISLNICIYICEWTTEWLLNQVTIECCQILFYNCILQLYEQLYSLCTKWTWIHLWKELIN